MAIILKETSIPDFIFFHPIFQSPEFQEFQKKVLIDQNEDEIPEAKKLRTLLPDIAFAIKHCEASQNAALLAQSKILEAIEAKVDSNAAITKHLAGKVYLN